MLSCVAYVHARSHPVIVILSLRAPRPAVVAVCALIRRVQEIIYARIALRLFGERFRRLQRVVVDIERLREDSVYDPPLQLVVGRRQWRALIVPCSYQYAKRTIPESAGFEQLVKHVIFRAKLARIESRWELVLSFLRHTFAVYL